MEILKRFDWVSCETLVCRRCDLKAFCKRINGKCRDLDPKDRSEVKKAAILLKIFWDDAKWIDEEIMKVLAKKKHEEYFDRFGIFSRYKNEIERQLNKLEEGGEVTGDIYKLIEELGEELENIGGIIRGRARNIMEFYEEFEFEKILDPMDVEPLKGFKWVLGAPRDKELEDKGCEIEGNWDHEILEIILESEPYKGKVSKLHLELSTSLEIDLDEIQMLGEVKRGETTRERLIRYGKEFEELENGKMIVMKVG